MKSYTIIIAFFITMTQCHLSKRYEGLYSSDKLLIRTEPIDTCISYQKLATFNFVVKNTSADTMVMDLGSLALFNVVDSSNNIYPPQIYCEPRIVSEDFKYFIALEPNQDTSIVLSSNGMCGYININSDEFFISFQSVTSYDINDLKFKNPIINSRKEMIKIRICN